MEGVLDCVQAFEAGTAHLVTSALVFAEVSGARVSPEMLDRFERLLRRRNSTVIDVDRRVAQLAGSLRDYYSAKAPTPTRSKRKPATKPKTLSTPDALHLATALIYDVTEFHTFDGKNKRKTLGLLPLDGDVAGRKLAIRKPSAGAQLPLDMDKRDSDGTEDEADENAELALPELDE
jgi:predicted nucleic acid-binding protein